MGHGLVCWSTTIKMVFCTDIHGSQMMNPNDSIDPLTFLLVPPLGGYFWGFGDMFLQPLDRIRVPDRAASMAVGS